MSTNPSPMERLLEALQERAKELSCLYQIEEILRDPTSSPGEICQRVAKAIPSGWQYPDVCEARIELEGETFDSAKFEETPWVQTADIVVQGKSVGRISVYYTEDRPAADRGPFLKEEEKLVQTIADRLGHSVGYHRMGELLRQMGGSRDGSKEGGSSDWHVVINMLKQTDRTLYDRISRKLLNHLAWRGVSGATQLMSSLSVAADSAEIKTTDDWNRPQSREHIPLAGDLAVKTFDIAAQELGDEEILRLVQKWIQEDKLAFLIQVVERNLSLTEVADALRRYHRLALEEPEPESPSPSRRAVEVSLIRRFLSDQLSYIKVAKDYIHVSDFQDLLQNIIYTPDSHGKLGGKSAGLYLAAQILKEEAEEDHVLKGIKVPRTWHITSDALLHFIHYNDFDEVVEQKYKDINQVRVEYPHIIQAFKNGRFPAEIIQGLSVALDDFGEVPLIVRSSSLLEDRVGAAFSGKYKSLFLANQGTKQERLDALLDAVAEVYASIFGPDPIEYRTERGLLDFGEEMGIILQQVVGVEAGRYFLPAFAGVAVSNNEFRWSPRIHRKDGLVRLVPGLGTRAVDRLSDDYPILIAPGQPGLRVNVSPDEVVYYSPRKVDVIDLETGGFATIELGKFLKGFGHEVPGIENYLSVYEEGSLSRPLGMMLDMERDETVVTFEGLLSRTDFISKIKRMLEVLEARLGTPVDIEFASDGRDFYLLQCRAQGYSDESMPAPIPRDIPEDQVVFSAHKYVSNGRVEDITHIVYVDPHKYAELEKLSDMVDVGRAVSRLNKLLPKRQFILMGPGRWGSRGDIKLGVGVTYSDINNTAVLVEISMKKGNYRPDLSFGTHFFQDLVEAGIRYLPLYPDDAGNVFDERFLLGAPNVLSELIPEYEGLTDVVRLIDVPQSTSGHVLRVLMNADLDEAIGVILPPTSEIEAPGFKVEQVKHRGETYWRWRLEMAERIAGLLDASEFGVAALYVFGSTKNATAGPGSDIDLIIHFRGDESQKNRLELWLDGWSRCLAEINYMRTGYRSDGLLDIHWVSDEDIARKESFAVKIDAATDPARRLLLKGKL